jgi:transketolase
MSALRSDASFGGIVNQNRAHQLSVLAHALADMADDDERIVAGSADLKVSTQMSEFEKRHPDRFYQFGISERNMIGAAAGMASCGLRPYVATFAAFSGLLAFENIRTDLAYTKMPVRVLATHAGISTGYFGTSHHALEDVSATRAVANLVVLSPCDGHSAAELIRQTHDLDAPIYIRLGRGREAAVYGESPRVEFGQHHVLRRGSDLAIFATGLMVAYAVDATEELAGAGVDATVVDVHTLKPFDVVSAVEVASGCRAVVTVEEHNTEGGLGTILRDALGGRGCPTPVYKHGIHDEFSIVGVPSHLYEYYGLDGHGVATVASRVLEAVDSGRFFDREEERIWTDADRAEAMEAVRARSERAKSVTT